MVGGDKVKAELIATSAFWKSTSGFARVNSLMRVGRATSLAANRTIEREAAATANMLVTDTDFANIFDDPSLVLSALGGLDGIAKKITEQHILGFHEAVDAAALIFAHAVLDWAATEYCKASAAASPADWESALDQRKVPLHEIREHGYESIFQLKLEAYLAELQRQPLLNRVDWLLKLCKPSKTSSATYSFSRPRLETLDRLRHSLVHEIASKQTIEKLGTELNFIQTTNYFLYAMLISRYQLSLRPEALLPSARPGGA